MTSNIKCLFFDVFGTCVDWRTSVTDALWQTAQAALKSPDSLHAEVREAAVRMVLNSVQTYEDWGSFAQEWRNTYLAFTRQLANDPSIQYKTVDQHHLDAFYDLLSDHNLMLCSPISPKKPDPGSLFPSSVIETLSLTWHHLTPWPDTNSGLSLLNKRFTTCTLTNGNLSLIRDMANSGSMPFTHLFSAEMFDSYKPNPKIYLGAAEKLGFKPEECAMVAAHLGDLEAARGCGFRTVYVERPLEERDEELKAKMEGVVDVWVEEDGDGFVEVARRLGIECA